MVNLCHHAMLQAVYFYSIIVAIVVTLLFSSSVIDFLCVWILKDRILFWILLVCSSYLIIFDDFSTIMGTKSDLQNSQV